MCMVGFYHVDFSVCGRGGGGNLPLPSYSASFSWYSLTMHRPTDRPTDRMHAKNCENRHVTNGVLCNICWKFYSNIPYVSVCVAIRRASYCLLLVGCFAFSPFLYLYSCSVSLWVWFSAGTSSLPRSHEISVTHECILAFYFVLYTLTHTNS